MNVHAFLCYVMLSDICDDNTTLPTTCSCYVK